MMRDFRLKTILFFQFLLISVVPIFVIALLFRFTIFPAVEREIGGHLRSLAIAVRDQTVHFLRVPHNALKLVGAQLVGMTDQAAMPLLDLLVQSVEGIDLVFLVGPDNRVSAVGLPMARQPYRADYLNIESNTLSLVERARASGHEEWSETFLSLANGELSVALAIPVDRRVLVAEFRLSSINDVLMRLATADDVLPMVIDERRGLIAHTLRDTPLNTVNFEFRHDDADEDRGVERFKFGNRTLVGYAVDIPGTHWIVVMAQSERTYDRARDDLLMFLVFGLVASFTISALSAMLLIRRFGSGFNALADHAEAIADGVYDHSPPRTLVREINRVSAKLADLGAAVRERETHLKREVETNARILAAIDLAKDLITVSDRHRNIIHTNKSALKSLGLPVDSIEAVRGQGWRNFQDKSFANRIMGLLDLVDREGFTEGELEWVRPDNGQTLNFMCRMGRLPDGGYILVWTDITEKTRLEADRQRNEQRAAQASKMEALGHLAGGVAHDFNNLLGAILGFAQFMVQDTEPGSQLRHFANRIVTAGNRGKSLIQQIMTFSRRGMFEPTPVQLEESITETCDLLRATLPSTTRLTFRTPGYPVTVCADKGQLSQVLINLCINANDALGDQAGEIVVELAPLDRTRPELARLSAPSASPTSGAVEFWTGQPGESWIVAGTLPETASASIRVTDEGPGIPPDILGQLFDPFFTTKEKGRGTGLGLAVVHSIVCEHGGGIVVHTRRGLGTRFEVILPEVAAQDHTADTALHARLGEATKATILIVDDDADFCQMLETALSRAGHEVVSTNAPLEALAAIEDDPWQWDIVITDQTMPNLKGADLIRKIKALRPTMLCILCSGYSSHIRESEAIEAGASAFLSKPIDFTLLFRQIDLRTDDLAPTTGN